jgi:tetratricopeptide (TPR) repeat protein
MSKADADRVYELQREASRSPRGHVQVQLLTEAVRVADSTRDLDTMFECRLELIEAATSGGRGEQIFAAFAWCLAQYEADPERFEDHEDTLLWQFKWVLDQLDEFPQISMAQAKKLFKQMADQYRRGGYSMRPVYYIEFCFAKRIGDFARAKKQLAAFQKEPRDSLADCMACELDNMADYYDIVDQPDKAIEAAQPIVKGKRRCAEIPHRTFSMLLRPLAQLGRYEEADAIQAKGYRLIRSNPEFLGQVAAPIVYLVHRDQIELATTYLQRHFSWALETCEQRTRYVFYIAAKGLFAKLAEGKPKCSLQLPEKFPLFSPSGEYELSEIIDWLTGQSREIGEGFNRRNGTTYYTDGLVKRLSY